MEPPQPNIPLNEILNPSGRNYLGSFRKRLMDVAGASIGLTLAAPIVLAAAGGIKLDDGGDVFYSQERIGLNGRPFQIYKLRTMEPNAHLQGTPFFNTQEDKRVTRVGRFLRRTSIDEFSQFWNVLKGDMSLVGPRPASMDEHLRRAELIGRDPDSYLKEVTIAKPGLTSLVGINGRKNLRRDNNGIKTIMNFDRYYNENSSFVLDLKIILTTIGVVIRGTGAC